RRHTRFSRDWSSDVCSSDLNYLHDELDLIREASNCSQLRRNFSPETGREHLLLIPEVVWEFCATTVFTMERMRGIPVSQIERLRSEERRVGKESRPRWGPTR